MTEDEYLRVSTQINAVYGLIRDIPLEDFIRKHEELEKEKRDPVLLLCDSSIILIGDMAKRLKKCKDLIDKEVSGE